MKRMMMRANCIEIELTLIMKLIIDIDITKVLVPDAPVLLYSDELHVAPQ